MFDFKALILNLQRIGDEAEHICTATREMQSELNLIRLRLERVDGRLERLEQALARANGIPE